MSFYLQAFRVFFFCFYSQQLDDDVGRCVFSSWLSFLEFRVIIYLSPLVFFKWCVCSILFLLSPGSLIVCMVHLFTRVHMSLTFFLVFPRLFPLPRPHDLIQTFERYSHIFSVLILISLWLSVLVSTSIQFLISMTVLFYSQEHFNVCRYSNN